MSSETPKEENRMCSIPYASVVGSIMYATLFIRSDIAYALGITSRFQDDPGENYWKVVKNILKYLRMIKDIFLVYSGSNLKLEGYFDSNFQSDPDDSKSISRYIFTLNSGTMSWKNFK